MLKKSLNSLVGMFIAVLTLSSCSNWLVDSIPVGGDDSKSSAKNITAFYIDDGATRISETEIAITVPYGTDVTDLAPAITVSEEASVSPESGEIQDFAHPVIYTVTAADGSQKVYHVTVTIASNSAKDILTFTIPNQYSPAVIDNVSATITLVMPYDTNRASLTPTITIPAGATITPSSLDTQNFTNPVQYTVTAADSSIKVYTVTVTTLYPGYITTFTGSVPFKMAYVPGGLTFKAGASDTTPTTVANAYWIGETSVTYELWNTVRLWATNAERGTNIYSFANAGVKGSAGTGTAQQPVTTINWRDSMIWTNALTEWYNAINGTVYTCAYYTDAGYTTPIRASTNSPTITGSTLGSQDAPYVKADATGFRMLTSMEWELAARYKGSDNSNGAYEWPVGTGNWWTPGKYASGATANYNNATATQAVAWYVDNSVGASHPVKDRPANALGLYDMSGNVWTWNFDWFFSGSYRVMRGGSWVNGVLNMQIGSVSAGNPSYAYGGMGFRLSRTAP